ncbi:transposase [Acidimicrobium ferrooxidans]|uniref:transposase n=1 Tax=Acidimicrobium ferrooxidans TaxID=53635 RepID=UPI00149485BB
MPSTPWSWRPASEGVSTRTVDDLVAALGGTGVTRSEVSRIVATSDEELAGFRRRRLDHRCVLLPPRRCHRREGPPCPPGHLPRRGDHHGRACHLRRTRSSGSCVGDGQTESFSPEYSRELRGPEASVVCASSSPMCERGLTTAIARCFIGTSWHRCRMQRARRARSHRGRGAWET